MFDLRWAQIDLAIQHTRQDRRQLDAPVPRIVAIDHLLAGRLGILDQDDRSAVLGAGRNLIIPPALVGSASRHTFVKIRRGKYQDHTRATELKRVDWAVCSVARSMR